MFHGHAKLGGYPVHPPFAASLPLPRVAVWNVMLIVLYKVKISFPHTVVVRP
jgi:hypothetical protein